MINTVFPGAGPASVRGIAAKAGLPPPIDLFFLFEKHCPVTGGTPGHAANDTDVNCDWVGSGGTDGCHPNDIGYGQVAALVAAAITQQPPEPLRGVPLLTGAKRLRTDDDGGSAGRRQQHSTPSPRRRARGMGLVGLGAFRGFCSSAGGPRYSMVIILRIPPEDIRASVRERGVFSM